MSRVDAPVLVMAGGTGGHIFPGIAVAEALHERGVPVQWLGAEGKLETELVPKAGIPIATLRIGGVRGKGLLRALRAPFEIVAAVLAARRVLRHRVPRSVLSLGGFAAGPGGIAARWLGVPLVIHEQNSVPGLTNRVLSCLARRVLTGFAGVFGTRGEWVGNPVRGAIAALPPPATRLAGRDGRLRLLVLGGSQGAYALNVVLPQVLQRLPATQRPEVRHQCGPKHLEKTRRIYAASTVEAEVAAFIHDMAAAYAWADLVVCRAGALTVAELCAAGLGAVLVPFPQAVDDHQTHNAEALVACGAARLVPEGEGFPERLAAALDALLGARAPLVAMAEAARTLAKPDAAARIAEVCLEVAA